MELKGEKVTLVAIKSEEKDEFYELATKSYGSKFWHDEEETKLLTKEKFFKEWHDGYFDLNSPEKGQCFWIIVNGRKIGQVNYNKIDLQNKKVEMDIIIGAQENMGKGYGSDSLRTLMKYLFEKLGVNKVWIEARGNNPRAIRAYEKAGFKKEGLLREENYFEENFVDCVRFGVLRRELVDD